MAAPLVHTEALRVPLAVAERLLKDRIADDALAALPDAVLMEPLGRRLWVVRERKATHAGSAGLITIPDEYQQQVYVGWVLATGAYIGIPVAERFPGGWHRSAVDLLGAKVLFSRGAFDHVLLTPRDRPHDCAYGILTDCDVKLIDRTDNALAAAVQEDYARDRS